MFGDIFYHNLLRKYTILIGTLFNNIKINRKDENGNEVSLMKVPLTYAPKDKMLSRVVEDPNLDRPSATQTLPMLSLEIGKMFYDGSRKLNTINKLTKDRNEDKKKFNYLYNPVPYNIEFNLYIYSKNVEDSNKILEQILPYFTPDWTTTVELIPEMGINHDIPILLNNVNYEDNYDGSFKERRAIVWTLNFVLKGYFYGPVRNRGVIKFVNANIYNANVPDGQLSTAVNNTAISEKITVQPGLSSNGQSIDYFGAPNNNLGTISYQLIEKEDDYGIIIQIYDSEEI
jgi:hypothetical protein